MIDWIWIFPKCSIYDNITLTMAQEWILKAPTKTFKVIFHLAIVEDKESTIYMWFLENFEINKICMFKFWIKVMLFRYYRKAMTYASILILSVHHLCLNWKKCISFLVECTKLRLGFYMKTTTAMSRIKIDKVDF